MIDQNVAEFEKMNVNKWHSYGYKGKGSTIVVLDSTHRPYIHTDVLDPFNNNIDKTGHKSQVAQVIREVAPEATIVVMSWFGGMKQEIVKWIKEHESEITSINCSFNTSVGTDIFELLEGVDIPIINSSGNGSDDEIGRGAKYPWTIAVGAWEEYRDNRARYSDYGEGLDFVAYTNIYITTESERSDLMFNGTSCSAPVINGLLAIYGGWLSEYGLPKLSRSETLDFLMEHSVDKLEEGYDFQSGHGLAVLPRDIPEVIVEEEEAEKEEEVIVDVPKEVDEVEYKDTKIHWAREYIDFISDKGIMKGYEDGSFQPNKPMTRAEVATVIARMQGFVPKK